MTLATVAVLTIRPNFLVHTDIEPAHIVRSLLFLPYTNHEGGVFPVLVQGWTLNYEMFFYALVALTLFLPERVRLWSLSAALALLVLAGLALRPQAPAAQTYTDPMLLEFLGGVWLGRAWEKDWLNGAGLGWLAILAGASALIAQHLLGLSYQPRALMWGAPALLIVAGALMLERSGAVGKSGALRLLGDASYAIYLVHGLLAGFVNWFLPATVPGLRGLTTLVGAIIAGIVIHKLFERPVTRWLRTPPTLARA